VSRDFHRTKSKKILEKGKSKRLGKKSCDFGKTCLNKTCQSGGNGRDLKKNWLSHNHRQNRVDHK